MIVTKFERNNIDISRAVDNNGYRLVVNYDEVAENPREWQRDQSTMICFHKRYELGDKHNYSVDSFDSWAELEKQIRKDNDIVLIKPLRLYDHSGITISISNEYPYTDQWDAGIVGYIFVTAEQVKDVKKCDQMAVAERIIKSHVKEYDAYISGQVYCYTLEKLNKCEHCGAENATMLDSCGGYTDIDDLLSAVNDAMIADIEANK